MRKGLLWAFAVLLASSPLANAQNDPSGGSNVTLPKAVLGPPDASKETAAPADVKSCWNSKPECPVRFWISTDYLLWWMKGGPVNTPLVTTGSLADNPPGALGQPGTQVLFGDRPIGYGALSGVRLGAGIELSKNLALEGNYFLIQRGAVHFTAASDGNGNPFIGRPFFDNQFMQENTLNTSTSDPAVGPYAGSTSVTSYTQLQGWELNLAAKHQINNNWNFVAIGGFRSLQLNEDLIIQDNIIPLAPGIFNGLVAFQNMPIDPPSTLSDIDRFRTRNTFYGGQVGGRLDWHDDRFTVGLVGKIALGVNQQIAMIDGSTTVNTPGAAPITVPGGVLALATNSGRFYKSVFSVVPEAGVNLGWNITPRLKATVGYTFIYWSDVARPGNQIDRNINPAQQPSNQNFGNGFGAPQPVFSFHESSFWAQGINLGLEFKF